MGVGNPVPAAWAGDGVDASVGAADGDGSGVDAGARGVAAGEVEFFREAVEVGEAGAEAEKADGVKWLAVEGDEGVTAELEALGEVGEVGALVADGDLVEVGFFAGDGCFLKRLEVGEEVFF